MKRVLVIKLSVSLMLAINVCVAIAQEPLLQKTIDQLSRYQNFSYRCIYKQKEVVGDTLTIDRHFTLLKTSDKASPGYLFTHAYIYAGMATPTREIFDGKVLYELNTTDSTFTISQRYTATYQQTLMGELKWFNDFYTKHTSKISRLNDTLYHAANCNQLRLTTRDTIINGTRQFAYIYLFIDKTSGLPAGKLTRSRTNDFGKEVSDYYTEEIFSDFHLNQPINTAFFNLPEGFHQPVPQQTPPPQLLAINSQAPDFMLFDHQGKSVSLSKLKGKIVLLDFFFVGCVPCMHSLAPLDSLHQQYGKKGLVILSISDRDGKKIITEFKKAQKISNTVLTEGRQVSGLYHVSAFPTFYLIDQNGKIAMCIDSYKEDLRSQLAANIETLMNKK